MEDEQDGRFEMPSHEEVLRRHIDNFRYWLKYVPIGKQRTMILRELSRYNRMLRHPEILLTRRMKGGGNDG